MWSSSGPGPRCSLPPAVLFSALATGPHVGTCPFFARTLPCFFLLSLFPSFSKTSFPSNAAAEDPSTSAGDPVHDAHVCTSNHVCTPPSLDIVCILMTYNNYFSFLLQLKDCGQSHKSHANIVAEIFIRINNLCNLSFWNYSHQKALLFHTGDL